ncbi:MAG TPA: AsmA-like C-terminal region-containing protein [Vicinamibacterales bacterium]
MKFLRWFIGIAGGVLVGLWIAMLSLSSTTLMREALVEALNDRLDAEVELGNFDVKAFPVLRIHGDRLKVRLKGQTNPASLIEIRHFEVRGGLLGLLHRQRRFTSVEIDGLRITIPPRSEHDRDAGNRAALATTGPVLIDLVTSKDAELIVVPKDPRKEPKVFAIHDLHLESVGFNRTMPFVATLSNPIPKGEIATKGTFGPWVKGDPGLTPVSGRYSFDRADLDTIKGIGGILKSLGEFSGHLSEIDVKGTTSAPDFSIDVGGTPMKLETTFHAVVDGTNGNTYLKQVDGRLEGTPIGASGSIESKPGVKGRTVKLDVKIADGRIEDVLKLAVRAPKPVMMGRIALQARLLLPPGGAKVVDRLRLDGRFVLQRTQFTDPGVQEKLAALSRRAQGKKPDEPMGRIVSDMRGNFVLKDGAIRFDPIGFEVPGADIELTGVYGLRSQILDLSGTLSMEATISKAAGGGIKGFFLKAVDPIFRKHGKGAVIPITIRGSRTQPAFGVQWGKVFK